MNMEVSRKVTQSTARSDLLTSKTVRPGYYLPPVTGSALFRTDRHRIDSTQHMIINGRSEAKTMYCRTGASILGVATPRFWPGWVMDGS